MWDFLFVVCYVGLGMSTGVGAIMETTSQKLVLLYRAVSLCRYCRRMQHAIGLSLHYVNAASWETNVSGESTLYVWEL